MDTPTFSFKGYLPNGFPVNVVVPITDDSMGACAYAVAFTNQLLADGFRLDAPGLETGEEREVIVTVMRRAKPADDTPIIDFYTEWGAGTDEPFGTYKYQHIYMDKDKPEVLADFLKFSGFKRIEDIPLYDAQTPLKRTFGKKHAKETAVPTPFKIVKKQGAEKFASDGKPYKPWEFVRFEAITPAPATPPPSQPATAQASEAKQPDYDAIEKAAREKAVTALDNEAITIFKVNYQPTHNGNGVPSWIATARIADGSTIPVNVGERGAALVTKAGYMWPKTDADNLAIDVITSVSNGKRYITSVICPDGSIISEEPRNAANANVGANNIISDAWLYDRTKLLYAIGKQFPKITPQERAATADKMHKEGLFDNVATLDGAVTMVANRLASHRQAVNQ